MQFTANAVFFAAIADKDFDEAKRLIESGLVDVNARNCDGLTALHQAVIDDNIDAVEFLLAFPVDLDATDNEGWTPLHAAASCGHTNIAQLLIEHVRN